MPPVFFKVHSGTIIWAVNSQNCAVEVRREIYLSTCSRILETLLIKPFYKFEPHEYSPRKSIHFVDHSQVASE